MRPGDVITIGPLPARFRSAEARLVRALPPPKRGELRNALAFLACTGVAVAALSLLSLIHP